MFTIPPSSVRSIGDELIDQDISWKYYGDQWNAYAGNGNPSEPVCNPPAVKEPCYIPEDKYQINYGAVGSPNALGASITNADEYCNICNPFQYDTSIMATPMSAPRTSRTQSTSTRHRPRHAARRFLRQAQRLRGRTSIFVEARSV